MRLFLLTYKKYTNQYIFCMFVKIFKMDKIIILYICGFFNIVLIIFHVLFWKVFNWKTTLSKGTKANAVAMQIMNIQLIYLFLAMSLLYFIFPNELLQTKIGNTILFGYAGFWIIRFLQQFIFLKMKGSFVIKLTLLFLFGAIIHSLPIII